MREVMNAVREALRVCALPGSVSPRTTIYFAASTAQTSNPFLARCGRAGPLKPAEGEINQKSCTPPNFGIKGILFYPRSSVNLTPTKDFFRHTTCAWRDISSKFILKTSGT